MERLAGYEIVEAQGEFFVAIAPQPHDRGDARVMVGGGRAVLSFTDGHCLELPDFPVDIAERVRCSGGLLVGELGRDGMARAYTATLDLSAAHA